MPHYLSALRLLAALLVISALFFACGGKTLRDSHESSYHTLLYPLTAYRSEAAENVVSVNKPNSRWLGPPTDRAPALVSRGNSDLAIKRSGLGGSLIRGRYGFPDHNAARIASEARFRISISANPKTPGLLLLDDTLRTDSPSAVKPLAVTIPEEAPNPAYVILKIDHISRGSRRAMAAWVDPVIEKKVRIVAELPRQPWNVLFITADTTRQDDLSCYGGPARTESLEELAADGVLFDNGYSVAIATTPSHTSLFTAMHAAQHGVYNNSTVVSPVHLTLPEVLASNGYSTSAFVSSKPLARSLGLSQGFDYFNDAFVFDESSALAKHSRYQRRASVTASLFLEWLNAYGNEPFFSWIHFYDPHQPYGFPTPSKPGEVESDRLEAYFRTKDGAPENVSSNRIPLEPPGLLEAIDQRARQRYRSEIEFMDSQVARIQTQLIEMGLYDRTVIVFIADHGENFLERGRNLAFGHGSVFGAVTQLPLIMKFPRSRYAGSRCDFLLGNIDIAPTILDLLGIPKPQRWSGRSFLSLLEDPAGRSLRQHLVVEGAHGHELSVRTRKWMYRELLREHRSKRKLARGLGYASGAYAEVYDLETDPFELNKADNAQCAEYPRFHELSRKFLARKFKGPVEELSDSEHLTSLRALGYVQ